MKMKFYLFSFLILAGLMSCQKEESIAPKDESGILTKNTRGHYVIETSADLVKFDSIHGVFPDTKCVLAYTDKKQICGLDLPNNLQSIVGLDMPKLLLVKDSMF